MRSTSRRAGVWGAYFSRTCVRVLCPLTGKLIACLLPLYDPMSLSLLMLSCIRLLRSFSIGIFDKAAVRSWTCLFPKPPTFAVGCM